AKRGGGFIQVKDVLSKVVDRIDSLFEQDSSVTGLSTGFIDFDDQTSGLQPADLVIVAGRPSMGKTTFAMNIAENAAIHSKQPVAVFSMEMPADSLAMRMLSSLGRIDQHRLRTGKLNDDDWPRLTSAIALLNEAPLFIDDTPALSPTELRARARRLKREHGLSLIVIDYLQLMQGSAGKASENRATEISEISRSLKALGKELEVPVVALSQLNRSLEQRPNKRPVMSDLRESGAIEQDADLIVFIYRDEVYNSDSPEKGKAEIIIGKQRNGPIGTVALTFQGKYTRFENFAPSYYDDQDNYPSYGEE
ncbi:MAG TPA: replicative DNA helicase, partial [Methylophaga aminisulfidivorans]|nr:replicative DNA helicase [Methylophaga aminisulfidivorans]